MRSIRDYGPTRSPRRAPRGKSTPSTCTGKDKRRSQIRGRSARSRRPRRSAVRRPFPTSSGQIDGAIASSMFQHAEDVVRVVGQFVRKAPSESDRRIDDEHYRRPSSISSRTVSPSSRWPRRKARKPAIASVGVMEDRTAAGASTATATPCFVIVMTSPSATSSRRRGRWVFASYAPIRRIASSIWSATSLIVVWPDWQGRPAQRR